MSIKYRLYGAFGILILVTLGLVIYGAWVFGDIGPVIIRMNSIATNNARTLQAAEHLEILRRTVLRYVYDRDPAARQENGEIAAKVHALLDQLPGADAAIAAARADDAGGLFGSMGGIMGVGSRLMAAGSVSQARTEACSVLRSSRDTTSG